jgi:hypothetical protein
VFLFNEARVYDVWVCARNTHSSITLQIYVSVIQDMVIKIGRAYLQTLRKRNIDDGWCCMLVWPGEYVS